MPSSDPTLTVSAVITTYNYGRFIAEAVESVLRQTRPPDEIVVVDDGSTDNTAEIVAGYAAQGVRYVAQPNAGGSASRNRGLRESQGDLIAFLDADDQWVPDKLALQLAHLQRYPTAGLVTASEWQVYESGDPPLRVERKPVGAANLYSQLLIENSVGNTSLALIRRTCFDRVGVFDERLPLGQDWDMWLRIGREFPIGVISTPLIYFRRHSTSMTAGRVWARYDSNRAFQRRYIGQERAPWRRMNLLRAAQSMNCYYTAAALANDPSQRRVARRMALTAALLDPTYETKLKFGVLFRALFGRAAFDRLRQAVRFRS